MAAADDLDIEAYACIQYTYTYVYLKWNLIQQHEGWWSCVWRLKVSDDEKKHKSKE